MNEELLEIMNFYKEKNQRKKLQEETYELIEALIEYENESYKMYTEIEKAHKEHIAEEIADCYVILEQFRLKHNIGKEKIKDMMDYKIKRQLIRIEKEKGRGKEYADEYIN